MSASKHCKEAGLKNMIELIELSNKPRSTLEKLYHKNPTLFNVIVLGCVAIKNEASQ